MSTKSIKPLAGALGAAFIIATTAVPLASAGVTGPFAAGPLAAGYELANFDQPMDHGMDHGMEQGGKSDKSGKEGNHGGDKSMKEANCGANGGPADSGMKHGDAAMSSDSGKEGKCGATKGK